MHAGLKTEQSLYIFSPGDLKVSK